MSEAYFLPRGVKLDPVALAIPEAKQLATYLEAGAHPFARIVETRHTAGTHLSETIVLEVETEVGQKPVCDIRSIERIAVTFQVADEFWPEVLALRSDFPRDLPHTFPTREHEACSLCLHEGSYEEQRLHWTSPKFVEQIRYWLRETSRGSLHAPDQPLERLFIVGFDPLIIPPTIFAEDSTGAVRISVFRLDNGTQGSSYVAVSAGNSAQGTEFVATVFEVKPSTQGAIRFPPQNLFELDGVTSAAGLDLLDGLRKRIKNWQGDRATLNARLILIVLFPKQRASGLRVEVSDIWAFGTTATIAEIGQALALWQVAPQGLIAHLVGTEMERSLSSQISVALLNPQFALTRTLAANANGSDVDMRKILTIGVGAVGSQIIGNLVRSGYGCWQFIDEDVFLPHNVARHELPHTMVGMSKARAMTEWANVLLAEPVADKEIIANALHPSDKAEAMRQACDQADVIADFSANQAVARHLARDVTGSARRLSAFLNPAGSDIVVLAEDAQRQIPIDCVEMQYYRVILEQPLLRNHFASPSGRIRTARSCRDVSTVLPGDMVSLLSAIGSRGVRNALAVPDATIAIWSCDKELNVRSVRLQVSPVLESEANGFRLVVDTQLVSRLTELRNHKLPRETGGVLLGSWDLQRRIVYIATTIPSPVDSEECPDSYIRGFKGLEATVRLARERTGSQVQYLGEWHSHPDGHTSNPSKEDAQLFEWLQNYIGRDEFPAVMLIVGEGGLRWFVGSL